MDELKRELADLVRDSIDFITTGYRTSNSGHGENTEDDIKTGKSDEDLSLNVSSVSRRTTGDKTLGLQSEPYSEPHNEKEKSLSIIAEEIANCQKCGLYKGRLNPVAGEGNPDADIMFIGEGPGEMEDIKGRPFVGRAGKLLTKMLAAIDLTREEVFITNIVKCRPPNNRTPHPEEVNACFPYLKRQIEIIQPLIICCLGGPAAKTLLNTRVGISKIRGTVQKFGEIPVIPTYHPAAVLRFPDKYKRAVWNDLKLLRDLYKELKSGT